MDLITYEDKVALNENASIPNNNKVTANDMNMIKNAINSMWNQQYPVGRIVMFYDLEDHSDYLGFTWQRCLVGNFPVGYDSSDSDFNTIGKTGGEKTHILSISEMPSHNHPIENTHAGGGVTTYNTVKAEDKRGWTGNIYTDNTGGGQAHNNLPPYEVISYWRRIA